MSKNTYNVEFKKDGYATASVFLDNGIGGGWLIFDLICGVVPAIIDAATGCWYTFDQVHLNAELEQLAPRQAESPAPKETAEPQVTPGKEYTNIGTGHWIKKVMDNGNMVILEDESIWEIQATDAPVVAKWPNATPISVGVGKGDYPYQLIDIGGNKAVQAKLVGKR